VLDAVGNDVSVSKDEISDEFPAPRNARRNGFFGDDEYRRNDRSDT
jgi:hypothetical protein